MTQFDNGSYAAKGRALPETSGLGDLLRLIANGDQNAFVDFYHRTSRRVHGLVRRVVIDADLSEDVTQEIFLMVWKDATRYKPDAGSPLAWLMMISHRRAVDRVRIEQSNTERAHRWNAARASIDYDSVAETVLDREEVETLTNCLNTLTSRQRNAIDMAFYGAMTHAEVARRLETPPGTVKTRIRDGLAKLRQGLEDA